MMGHFRGPGRDRPEGGRGRGPQVATASRSTGGSSVEELRAQVGKLQEQQEQMAKALKQIGQALEKISSRN